jgi:hypothetical protein
MRRQQETATLRQGCQLPPNMTVTLKRRQSAKLQNNRKLMFLNINIFTWDVAQFLLIQKFE